MNDLRTGFLQRHRKRLYDPIDLAPSPAKRVCLDRGGEDPVTEVPLSIMAYLDEAGSSAAAAVQPNAVGSNVAATAWPDVPGPSAAAVAQPGVIAHNNAPTAVETRGTEGVPEAAIDEEALDEKSSPAATVPPSWEEMMEMLKGVPCFTDAEAPSTRMFDFFSLTKRVSVNMGGDPPAFVKARLLFGTLESIVSCIQHLQEWTIPETTEVVIISLLLFPSSLAIVTPLHDISFCFVVVLRRSWLASLHDAYAQTALQAAGSGGGYARLHLSPSGWC